MAEAQLTKPQVFTEAPCTQVESVDCFDISPLGATPDLNFLCDAGSFLVIEHALGAALVAKIAAGASGTLLSAYREIANECNGSAEAVFTVAKHLLARRVRLPGNRVATSLWRVGDARAPLEIEGP